MRELNVRIGFEDDVTPREADQYTRDLLRELERLDIDRAEIANAAPEPGTRTDAATVLGAITLAGLSLRTVLPHVVTVVQSWLETSAQKSVTLEVEGRRLQVEGRVTADEMEKYLKLLGTSGDDENADGRGGDA